MTVRPGAPAASPAGEGGRVRRPLVAALFPETPRQIPHERWINIAFRSAHIVSSGILLGGHAFDLPADRLFAWLIATVASGIALAGLELYRSFQWLYLLQGVLVLAKVLLTILAGLFWGQRVPLLVAVAVMGSVGSHMSSQYRHHSLLHGREYRFAPKPGRQARNDR